MTGFLYCCRKVTVVTFGIKIENLNNYVGFCHCRLMSYRHRRILKLDFCL